MMGLGFFVAWWGYLEGVYGWCLLRGYDVTWRQLADPAKLYEWPGTVPKIPASQILPGGAAAPVAAGPQAALLGTAPGSGSPAPGQLST
jgi:hypothetical protein